MADANTIKGIIASVGVPDEFVDAAYDKADFWANWVVSGGDLNVLKTANPKQQLLVKALKGMLSEPDYEVPTEELDEIVAAVYSRILDWNSWASPNDSYFWDYDDNVEPGRNESF